MNKKALSPKSLQEAISYLRKEFDKLNAKNELEVAYRMASLISNDKFDDWYEGDKAEMYFSELFDLVADLEVPDGPAYFRKAQWGMVEAYLRLLEEKYPAK